MIVRVLGSAAGGGVPQWNCACTNCAAARRGTQPVRLQSSLAVSADGVRWLLLNVSPDIGAQIEAFAPLQPHERRGTPIAGALLTDANVDHLGGLVTLRQAGSHAFVLHSSAVIRDIATAQPAFAAFAQAPHRWIAVDAGPVDDDDLLIRAIPVPGSTPGFAGRRAIPGAVVAYAIRDRRGGGTLLFAPVFSAIDDTLAAEIRAADVAFLDGSFYTDDEMIAMGLGDKHATALGHLPASGPTGTIARVAGWPNRRIFTHLNNSNPMLDPSSDAAHVLAQAGMEIAFDGMEFTL